MPRDNTIAKSILDIIKNAGSNGIQRKNIMKEIFRKYHNREYDPILDRGWYSSYFYDNSYNRFFGKYQYGIIPEYCRKISGTNLWIYNR